MADESVVALLARENKNAVMLLNERRRALKWEERQGIFQFEKPINSCKENVTITVGSVPFLKQYG